VKTIFFLFPIRIAVRNFLFTGVLERLLKRRDLRVVAVTGVPDVFERYGVKNERLSLERFPPRSSYTFTDFLHAVLERRFYKTSEITTSKILSKGPLKREFRESLIGPLLSQPLPRSKTLYGWLRSLAEHRNSTGE